MRGGRGQAIVLICSPDGFVLEVLLDELGIASRLAPGKPFASLFAPEYLQTAKDFLLRVPGANSLVEEEFKVLLPMGYASLYFSAHATARGIIVFGGTKALTRAAIVRRVRALLRRSRRFNVDRAGAKNGVLGLTAHDLKNPIAGILAASQYLLDEPPSSGNEEHVRLLQSIQTSSRFLLQLIDDVLDISALEAGQVHLQRRPVDILALLQQNLVINQFLATSKGVLLSVIAEEGVPSVFVEPARISKVIESLIGTAIGFSPEAGTIEIRVGRRDGMALISVRDQGSGIPHSELHTLFELFRKDSSQLSPEKRVLSRRLAIVRSVVESHGGVVEIESEVGRGSTFTVLLPATGVEIRPGRKSAGQG